MLSRRQLLAASAGLFASRLHASTGLPDAPNVIAISDSLVTSGQPTRASLAGLSGLGFQAVIYLAPGTVSDAVRDEPQLLQAQGIEFVHIPIPFNAPTEAHYLELAAALDRLGARRVLVHCQINMRASTMVFLYRVIARREDPSRASEAVSRVWAPDGPWKQLGNSLLRKNGVGFEFL